MRSSQITRLLIVCAIATALAAMGSKQAHAADSSNRLPDDVVTWTAKNFGKLLARATNEEAVEFGKLLSETSAYLADADPGKCVRMLMPSVHGPLREEDWPQQFLARQMAVQRRIVRTALQNPTPIPTEDEAGPVFDKVYKTLADKYGSEAVKVLQSTDKNVNLPELVPSITRGFGVVKHSVFDGCQVAERVMR